MPSMGVMKRNYIKSLFHEVVGNKAKGRISKLRK